MTINVYRSSELCRQFNEASARDTWKRASSFVRYHARCDLRVDGARTDFSAYFGQGWYQTANRTGFGRGVWRATPRLANR